jgi:hypothetical protein
LLAKYPVSKLVECEKKQYVADSRLRALYCISNPERDDVSKFDADGFRSAMESVFEQFPMVDVRAPRVQTNKPSAVVVLAGIRDFTPQQTSI